MKIANLNNITASSGIAAADEKDTQTVTAEKKAAFAPNRLDRYEGTSFIDGAEKGWSNLDCITPEVCNGRFNEDNVALIASSVGKYIDSLFQQGKYTDDEYAQLNAEIKNCSKHWLSKIVDARVGKRLRDEDAKIYGGKFYVKMPAKSREQRRLEEIAMQKRVEAENPFDFDAFFKKVEQMRFNVVGIKSSSKKGDSGSANANTNL